MGSRKLSVNEDSPWEEDRQNSGVSSGNPQRDISSLLLIARNGSSEALGELLEGCRNYLLLIANHTIGKGLRSKVGASDLVQETFVEAHRIFERFTGESEQELLRWLAKILHFKIGNTFKSYYRAERRNPQKEVDWYSLYGFAFSEAFATVRFSPSGFAVRKEQKELYEELLQDLGTDFREVIRLRVEEELSFEEVGCQMGRSEDAARKLFMRAVALLRERLRSPKHGRRTAGWSST